MATYLDSRSEILNVPKTLPQIHDLGGKPEFLNKDGTIIVFNDRITGHDVIQSLRPGIESKFWAKNSKIMIICGFHTFPSGKMGASFSAFHSQISRHLEDIKSSLCAEINEMDYDFESILLSTVPYQDEDCTIKYELDSMGQSNLKSRFSTILESRTQHVLVFGTCFSKKSVVNDYISDCGLYPAMFLSSDLGYVTDGRRFELDEQQKYVIKHIVKVKFQYVYFYYSSVTGKTIQLAD